MSTCAALNILSLCARENAYAAATKILINNVLIHVNQVASEVLEGEKAAVASGILEASVTSKVSEGSAVLEARPNQETRNLLG